MKFYILSLLFSSWIMASETPNCAVGLAAFEKTVHVKLVKDCMQCHGGSEPNAPPFATLDLNQSYYRILNYTNFQIPEQSTVVVRAGNSHCKKANCDKQSGIEMLEKIQQWWNEGQKDCPIEGKFFTSEMPIPSNFPDPKQGFITMEWDLKHMGNKFDGYSFQLEGQQWAKETPTNPGAYRFRLPRISAGKKSLWIKDIRILINRRFDPIANAYASIDLITSPQSALPEKMVYPMLSADTLITNQIGKVDKISISFDTFEKVQPVECKDATFFADNIVPYFTQGMCSKCHGNEENSASRAFSTLMEVKQLCRSVRERMDFNSPMQSSFLKIVAQGKFQHPETLSSPDNFVTDLLAWIEKEK